MAKMLRKTISVILSLVLLASCLGMMSFAVDVGTSGTFTFLVQNVAGLPIPENFGEEDAGDPYLDAIGIGEAINFDGYDIVAVQEDFNYDSYFRAELKNYTDVYSEDGTQLIKRRGTEHLGGVPAGDGLNIFTSAMSGYYVYNTERVAWEQTYGITDGLNDELTPKGFAVTTVELEEGYYLDVYDLHADAGGLVQDVEARAAEYKQLADFIMKHSVYDEKTGTYDHAVIIGGDFNTYISSEDTPSSSKLVENLIEAAHLNDAWAVYTLDSIPENDSDADFDYSPYYNYAANDAVPPEITDEYTYRLGHYDSVERILYASGNGIDLDVDNFSYGWYYDDYDRAYSDHPYALGRMSYTIIDKVQDNYHSHDDVQTDGFRGFLLKFLNYIRGLFRSLGLLFSDIKKWGN